MLGAITRSFKCQKLVHLQRASAILLLFSAATWRGVSIAPAKELWHLGDAAGLKWKDEINEKCRRTSADFLLKAAALTLPSCVSPPAERAAVHYAPQRVSVKPTLCCSAGKPLTGGDPLASAFIYFPQTGRIFRSRFFSSLKYRTHKEPFPFIWWIKDIFL